MTFTSVIVYFTSSLVNNIYAEYFLKHLLEGFCKKKNKSSCKWIYLMVANRVKGMKTRDWPRDPNERENWPWCCRNYFSTYLLLYIQSSTPATTSAAPVTHSSKQPIYRHIFLLFLFLSCWLLLLWYATDLDPKIPVSKEGRRGAKALGLLRSYSRPISFFHLTIFKTKQNKKSWIAFLHRKKKEWCRMAKKLYQI